MGRFVSWKFARGKICERKEKKNPLGYLNWGVASAADLTLSSPRRTLTTAPRNKNRDFHSFSFIVHFEKVSAWFLISVEKKKTFSRPFDWKEVH